MVLPAFHRFAADAFLVAHNAALISRFSIAPPAPVVDQPVVDTLLLSAHPPGRGGPFAGRHRRALGLDVVDRHSAVRDSLLRRSCYACWIASRTRHHSPGRSSPNRHGGATGHQHGLELRRGKRRRDRLIGLFARPRPVQSAGAVAVRGRDVFGWPLLFVYLFCAWAARRDGRPYRGTRENAIPVRG